MGEKRLIAFLLIAILLLVLRQPQPSLLSLNLQDLEAPLVVPHMPDPNSTCSLFAGHFSWKSTIWRLAACEEQSLEFSWRPAGGIQGFVAFWAGVSSVAGDRNFTIRIPTSVAPTSSTSYAVRFRPPEAGEYVIYIYQMCAPVLGWLSYPHTVDNSTCNFPGTIPLGRHLSGTGNFIVMGECAEPSAYWRGDVWVSPQPFVPHGSMVKPSLLFLGDSTMRGIYFDVLDSVTGFQNSRTWAKGKSNLSWSNDNSSVSRLEWRWLQPTSTHAQAISSANWTAIFINFGIHEASHGSWKSFLPHIQQTILFSKLVKTLAPATRVVWRTGTPCWPFPWLTNSSASFCRAECRWTAFRSFARCYLYQRTAVDVISADGTMEVVDVWSPAVARPDLFAPDGVHGDRLYKQPGVLSRVFASELVALHGIHIS